MSGPVYVLGVSILSLFLLPLFDWILILFWQCGVIGFFSSFYSFLHYFVCQWLVAGGWFSPVTPVSSTNKTYHHNITEIMLKVPLNTITLTHTFINRYILYTDINYHTWSKWYFKLGFILTLLKNELKIRKLVFFAFFPLSIQH
jgi:hypothetical protein